MTKMGAVSKIAAEKLRVRTVQAAVVVSNTTGMGKDAVLCVG
jgi:hypothetical protein